MRPEVTGIGDEAAPDLAGQIAVARRLGWSRLELRTIDGVPLAELPAPGVRAAVDALSRSGLGVVCLASRIANWSRPVTAPFELDLAELDALAVWAGELGCRHVRIMSYPNDGLDEERWRAAVLDRVRRLADRAAALGLVLLHENCSGWAATSARRMLELVRDVDSPALRLLFDTGNGVAHGYEAYDVAAQVVAQVAHVHVKDAVRTPDGPRYTLPGDGEARVVDCLRLLAGAGYTGAYSLEPHLAAVPHRGVSVTDGAAETFVEAARRLHALLRTHVPAAPSRGAGG